ncbi:hypothetical protein NHE_0872 [Neorickettsia helminthoeca str. Oregon]|uniref:Uncharacterized protein n=1 Tax=Neorickettsia helminthoeca str. Oregon TaxID=1286528 RepID=X5H5C7_9RICK|nr:hypothetical protein NHE_0872 [Neorickettsia helminthoeca str. Oregon]
MSMMVKSIRGLPIVLAELSISERFMNQYGNFVALLCGCCAAPKLSGGALCI